MSFIKYCLIVVFLVFATSIILGQEIQWMTWEQAASANEKKNRKRSLLTFILIGVGGVKKMDATTFKDPAVVAIMNEKFYAVKLNAEQKESIIWKEQEFKWMAGGRGGVNTLAYELLDGKLSFPSFVMLDGAYSRIAISPGFKDGPAMIKELKYAGEEHYKTSTWEEYQSKSR